MKFTIPVNAREKDKDKYKREKSLFLSSDGRNRRLLNKAAEFVIYYVMVFHQISILIKKEAIG